MATSCNSALKTSTPISREPRPRHPALTVDCCRARSQPTDQASPPICPARMWLDIEASRLSLLRRPVAYRSARLSARCSTSCRHGCGCIRIRRPRYGCRACGTIHQASAPERPIAKGLATPGTASARPGVQILRSPSALPAEPDLRPARRRARSFDARQLGRRSRAGGWSRCRRGSPRMSLRSQSVCRRHPDPSARSWPGPDQDRPTMGLRSR